MSLPVILIYGFEPFGAYRRNITEAIVSRLRPGPNRHARVLPVRFEPEIFLPLAEELRPDYLLGLGQCPRGELLRIERRAHNGRRARREDVPASIEPGGPASIAPNWRLPGGKYWRDSYDAGRYVCNYSMYLLGRRALNTDSRYAFVHVPRTFAVGRAVNEIERLLARIEAAQA